MADQGLTIIYTGNGKGKTCAAFGQALRAAGNGFKIAIIQFIKEKKSGEAKALETFGEQIELAVVGSGFSWAQKDMQEFKDTALAGWKLARDTIMSGRFDMVILDELTYLIHFEIIRESEVVEMLIKKPQTLHVVITGRNAGEALVAKADLVTEMREIKHPYRTGIKAQKGIEF